MNALLLCRLTAWGRTSALLSIAVLFLLGSFVYIGSPTISGTNLISAIAMPMVAWSVLTSRLDCAILPSVLAFALLLVLSGIVLVADPVPENIRLMRGVISSGVACAGAAWFHREEPRLTIVALKTVVLIAAAVAALQASFLAFGIGIDPVIEDQVAAALAAGQLRFGLPSFFGNPNNFSVFAGLAVIYFGVQGIRVHSVWTAIAFACVVASGSRTVLMFAVAWMVTLHVLRTGWWGALRGVLILVAASVAVTATEGQSGFYLIDRTYGAFSELLSGEVQPGSSLDVRGRSHLFFLENYGSFLGGSFDASRPFDVFANTGFDDSLVKVNPHSLVIELHALFGLFGLLIILGLAFALALLLARRLGRVRGAMAGVAIVFFSAVPSSVLQFHVFFAVVTLIAHGAHVPVRPRIRAART